MSEAKILVPSFGNWDMAADISYTVMFDKVRAMKDADNVKSNDLGNYAEAQSASRLEDNPSCVQAKFENNSFHKVNNSTMACSHHINRSSMEEGDSWRQNSDLRYGSDSSSSRRSTLQKTAHHILAESRHAAGNGSPAESWRSTSSSHSRRSPHVVGKEIMNKPLGKDFSPTGDSSVARNKGYHHRSCRRQLPTSPAKEGKMVRTYSLERGILPKFGDWDATDLTSGEDFTVIFNRAREEKKSKNPCDGTLQPKASSGIDEDLYKPSLSRKSSSGIWSLLCCSHASPA